jgi:hypothetical protein
MQIYDMPSNIKFLRWPSVSIFDATSDWRRRANQQVEQPSGSSAAADAAGTFGRALSRLWREKKRGIG